MGDIERLHIGDLAEAVDLAVDGEASGFEHGLPGIFLGTSHIVVGVVTCNDHQGTQDDLGVTGGLDSLDELVVLKTIANSLQRRVSANYRFVLTFNSALIALGAMGILQPASSAMLHNLSTIGISLKSMTNLIPEEKAQKALAEKN